MKRSQLMASLCVGLFLTLSLASTPTPTKSHVHPDHLAKAVEHPLLRILSQGQTTQPECCQAWDLLPPSQKVGGRKHIHGALGPKAKIPMIALTSLWVPQAEDCKNRAICVTADDPLLGKPGVRSCHASDSGDCGRQCGDKRPITGCNAHCCEKKCACPGDCP